MVSPERPYWQIGTKPAQCNFSCVMENMYLTVNPNRTLFLLLLILPGLIFAQSADNLSTSVSVEPASADQLLESVERSPAFSIRELRPYGESLFRGGFSNDREDGLNPEYLIQPGDSVSVRIWGATQFNESVTVDHQGNIFIPGVGPISLNGVSNRSLNERVTSAVASVYTDNVKVYTSLDGSQPVAVYVTGYVVNPGRFSGIPSNSILYFLDRAGGIDATRGSYRSISIQRDNQTIVNVDLYSFLSDGELESVQFRDGDTIVVSRKGASVGVTGDVNNEGLLEIKGDSVTGEALIDIAMLHPGVSYVGITGIRNGASVARYESLSVLKQNVFIDGDLLHFKVDQNDSMVLIDVEGPHFGPSRYAVPRNTRLHELLDNIEVDRQLADIDSISLKRIQIAKRQKDALNESLRRLQSRYLTASSQTDAESAIRTREAELITQFVETARNVQPNGRLVVVRNGEVANVLLQSGDVVSIPEKTQSILLSGEVLVSQAILHEPGMRAREYIERSGGFTDQADEKRIVVVKADGTVGSGENPKIRTGDEIIVLPKVAVKNLQIASTIVDIIYKIAVAASVTVNL